jgi:Rod binding domain-containing protein
MRRETVAIDRGRTRPETVAIDRARTRRSAGIRRHRGGSPVSAPLAIGTVTAGVPVVDEARAPAAVRNGSSAVKQAYSSAQGFEEMLMQQLSQSMLASGGLGEVSSEGEEGSGEEGGSSESSGALSSLLPQALTEGVMREGGLGLASQLMRSLDPAASSTAAVGAGAGATPHAGAGAAGSAVAPSGGVAATSPASATAGVGQTGGTSA